METNKLKIELIRKLVSARLTQSEREEVMKKAKELIQKESLTKISLALAQGFFYFLFESK